MAGNLLNISTNRIVNTDGSLNIIALQNIIAKLVQLDDSSVNPFKGFEGRQIIVKVTKAVSNLKVAHGLNFVPKFGIIGYQSSSTPTITLNYPKFDSKNINVTTTGPVEFKVLVGRLDE